MFSCLLSVVFKDIDFECGICIGLGMMQIKFKNFVALDGILRDLLPFVKI